MNDLLPPTVPVPLDRCSPRPRWACGRSPAPAGETAVHSVHTSEMADPVPYLLGGELLLSAGVQRPARRHRGGGRAPYWRTRRYVARTVEAGAAALGFGIAPVHDAVPAALVRRLRPPRTAAASRCRADTPFTAVARAVWQAMAERRHRELSRLSEAQRALAAAAAGARSRCPRVLRQLARHVDGWAALLGPGRRGAGRGGRAARRPGSAPRSSPWPGGCGPARPPPRCAGRTPPDRLRAGSRAGGGRLALGLCAPHRDAGGGASPVWRRAALAARRRRAARGAEARRSAALVRLLLGAPAGRGGGRCARGRPVDVVHGRRRRDTAAGGGGAGARRGRPVHGRGPRRRAGHRPWSTLGRRAARPGARPRGRRRRCDGAPHSRRPAGRSGCGPPVRAADLARGDAEAARALRRAARGARGRWCGSAPGAGRGLAALVAPERGPGAGARARLAPLGEQPALVETLRMWLSLHGELGPHGGRPGGAPQHGAAAHRPRRPALLDADLDDRTSGWSCGSRQRWVVRPRGASARAGRRPGRTPRRRARGPAGGRPSELRPRLRQDAPEDLLDLVEERLVGDQRRAPAG